MTQESSASGIVRKINSCLLHIRAGNAKLDPNCSAVLQRAELAAAYDALRPVFELSDSLEGPKCGGPKSVKLDEAMAYLRNTRLCELLLSLLRRWPWAEMQGNTAVLTGLGLLPSLLRSLRAIFQAVGGVRSRQQTAAFTEMCKRCLSQACFAYCAMTCSVMSL